MSYDTQCHDLATHFLPDLPIDAPAIKKLAQAIQTRIEDFLEFELAECDPPSINDWE